MSALFGFVILPHLLPPRLARRFGGVLGLGGERPCTAPLEQCFGLRTVSGLHAESHIEERAVQQCAVIVGECDQPAFCTKPPNSIRCRVRSRLATTQALVSARARAASSRFRPTFNRFDALAAATSGARGSPGCRAKEFGTGCRDAQLAREVEFAIPCEMTKEQGIALARDFVAKEFVSRGMVADLNVHWDIGSDGQAKPHAHVNDRLQSLGIDARIDHRSYEALGIGLEPQHKIGAAGARRFESGEDAERANEHRAITRSNGAAILGNPEIGLDALTRTRATFTARDLAMFAHRHSDGKAQFDRVLAAMRASLGARRAWPRRYRVDRTRPTPVRRERPYPVPAERAQPRRALMPTGGASGAPSGGGQGADYGTQLVAFMLALISIAGGWQLVRLQIPVADRFAMIDLVREHWTHRHVPAPSLDMRWAWLAARSYHL